MQADLYIRVSTEEQKKFGFSQRYQEQALKSYCSSLLIEVGEVVFEDCSAKTFDRPAWKKLFHLYHEKKLCGPRLLLFTKWDRFSRNTGDAYYMIYQLSLLQIEVRAIEQPLDLSIPETKIMMAFYLAAPEVENARRSLNIRQGLQRGLREGRYMGKAPIGYANKINSLGFKYIEPLQPYADLIRLAFEELAKGVHSTATVYRYLITRGFDRTISCLREALRNPVYCGNVRSPAPGNKQQWTQGQHTAIVSEEIFGKVQKELSKNRVHTRKAVCDIMFPLRGLLICKRCNKLLTGSGSKGRHQIYYYYHCRSICGVRYTTASIHEEFLSFIGELVPGPYFLNIYNAIFDHQVTSGLNEDINRKLKLQSQLDELELRIDKARQYLLSDGIDIQEYKLLKESCEHKISVLQETILNKSRIIESRTMDIYKKKEYICHLDQLFQKLEPKYKRELAGLLFPFGTPYSLGYFSIGVITPALQIVYDKDSPHQHLSTLPLRTVDDRSNVDQLQESLFVKEHIRNILHDIGGITLRQVLEITTYFRRIVLFSQFLPG